MSDGTSRSSLGNPTSLCMSTVHRRLNGGPIQVTRERPMTRMKRKPDENGDNSRNTKSSTGGGGDRRGKKTSRIDCSKMSLKREKQEGLDQDQDQELHNSENEIESGIMVRDGDISIGVIPKRKPRRIKRHVERPPQNEIELLIKDLLVRGKLPPPDIQPRLIEFVRWERTQAVIKQDYDRAGQLESVLNLVSDGYEWQMTEQRKTDMMGNIEDRIETARERIGEEEAQWNEMLDEFYEQQNRDREKMRLRHEEDKAEFEEKWNNPEFMMRNYAKLSPRLLQMRAIQKNMALVNMFDNAKRVKLAADALQESETARAEDRATLDMQQQYKVMNDKHRKEIACFEEHDRRVETFLIGERNRTVGPIERLLEQLQARKDRDAPPNLKPCTHQFTSTAKSRAFRTTQAIPARSERTTRAIADFRGEGASHLSVSGLNVKQIMKGRSARRAVSVSRVKRGSSNGES